jgi:hypothetical protein
MDCVTEVRQLIAGGAHLKTVGAAPPCECGIRQSEEQLRVTQHLQRSRRSANADIAAHGIDPAAGIG